MMYKPGVPQRRRRVAGAGQRARLRRRDAVGVNVAGLWASLRKSAICEAKPKQRAQARPDTAEG